MNVYQNQSDFLRSVQLTDLEKQNEIQNNYFLNLNLNNTNDPLFHGFTSSSNEYFVNNQQLPHLSSSFISKNKQTVFNNKEYDNNLNQVKKAF